MAGGHGGARPGAGRPPGSGDCIHRKGEKRKLIERATAEATQYLQTNDMKIFDGDGIALMISVYKNEALPLNIRIQCAMAASPFERPRLTAVDARVSLQQPGDNGEDYGDALLNAIQRQYKVAEQKFIASELIPPDHRPVGKHAPRPPTIDGESARHGSDKAAETGGNAGVSDRMADMQSAAQDAAPQPEQLPAPVDPDMIEVNIPTRSGVITKYVPRIR
jgi:hypothetical protein